MRRDRGFTIIELLTTCAIVVVLAGCLIAFLPIMQNAIVGSQCTSRLQTLGQAMTLYAQDNNQTLPASAAPTFGQTQGIWFTYQELLRPYLALPESGKAGSFACPVDKDFYPAFPSYIFNGANEYDAGFLGVAGKRIPAISEPSRTLLLVEGCAVFSKSWHALKNRTAHNDARSYASFVDGHVAAVAIYASGAPLNAGVNPPAGYEYKWGD